MYTVLILHAHNKKCWTNLWFLHQGLIYLFYRNFCPIANSVEPVQTSLVIWVYTVILVYTVCYGSFYGILGISDQLDTCTNSSSDISAIHMLTFTYLCKFYIYVNFTYLCKSEHVNVNTYQSIFTYVQIYSSVWPSV